MERIVAEHGLPPISTIVLVRPDEVGWAERCIELGAEDYLSAPVNPTLLKLRVNAILQAKYWRDHQAERERLLKVENDVDIARQIQLSFLPKTLPKGDNWEVEGRYYPARMVVGDWYDVFPLSNNRKLGIVIADVCDKGVHAAMFMALCRSLIRAYAQQNYSLGWMNKGSSDWLGNSPPEDRRRLNLSSGTIALKTAVELTNAYIIENHYETNMFATLFFGMLDPVRGQLHYINGGHNPPYVITKEGQIKAKLNSTGPAVGMFPKPEFDIQQTDLDPGDILFCYTDGLPDARNIEGERFSDQRVLSLLQQPCGSVNELIQRVDGVVHSFIGAAQKFDDITLVAVRMLETTAHIAIKP